MGEWGKIGSYMQAIRNYLARTASARGRLGELGSLRGRREPQKNEDPSLAYCLATRCARDKQRIGC